LQKTFFLEFFFSTLSYNKATKMSTLEIPNTNVSNFQQYYIGTCSELLTLHSDAPQCVHESRDTATLHCHRTAALHYHQHHFGQEGTSVATPDHKAIPDHKILHYTCNENDTFERPKKNVHLQISFPLLPVANCVKVYPHERQIRFTTVCEVNEANEVN
jgi:hypothetical protein